MRAKRTTREMIEELDKVGTLCLFAAIAVYFPNMGEFIKSDDAKRVQRLWDAKIAGGVPLGLITVERVFDETRMKVWLYPEHIGDEQRKTQLDLLSDYLLEHVIEQDKPPTLN